LIGFAEFEMQTRYKQWSEDDLERVSVLAEFLHLYVTKVSCYVTGNLDELSLAIPVWAGAMTSQ